jgi:hypothetical protein
MKSGYILFTFLLFGSACEKTENPLPSNSRPEALNAVLQNGEGWSITRFTEEGKDYSARFRPYLFTFHTDGTVKAEKTGESIVGTYDSFRDDGKTELRMQFPMNSALYELSDDWYFVSAENRIIRFADQQDKLEFEKQ